MKPLRLQPERHRPQEHVIHLLEAVSTYTLPTEKACKFCRDTWITLNISRYQILGWCSHSVYILIKRPDISNHGTGSV